MIYFCCRQREFKYRDLKKENYTYCSKVQRQKMSWGTHSQKQIMVNVKYVTITHTYYKAYSKMVTPVSHPRYGNVISFVHFQFSKSEILF